tara:strand:+ start:236 stop:826 length:591 start_codon:yes stop_codon:yes gene_type:complete
MALTTYTAGEVLTAQSLNDNLAYAVTVPASTPGGLVPITAETSFTATTGVTVSDVFTSTYSNYLLTVITTINGASTVELQFSVGGTATATGYNYQHLLADSTTVLTARTTSSTSGLILRGSNGTYTQVTKVEIYNPEVLGITMYQTTALNQQSAITPYIQQIFGNQQATTQFDGFKLLSANNITGTYQLYGYNKTV